jgi:hypothetical protein
MGLYLLKVLRFSWVIGFRSGLHALRSMLYAALCAGHGALSSLGVEGFTDCWLSLRAPGFMLPVVDPVEDPEALEGSAVEGLYAALFPGHGALSLFGSEKRRA